MHSETPIPALLDQLDRAIDRGAWHGPALREVLAGVTAAEAAARPLPTAHTIWELVLHLASWTEEVAARLAGEVPGEPRAGDWPTPATTSDEAWMAARARLWTACDELRSAVAGLAATDLERWVAADSADPAGDPVLGTGVSVAGMLHGLVQHHAYHGGQIILLTKAVRAAARPVLPLRLLPGRYAVRRFDPATSLVELAAAAAPAAGPGELWCLARTAEEVSLLTAEASLAPTVAAERGFRALAVAGPLPFGLIGIVAALADPLAAQGIPIFVVSTYDTDLVLVRDEVLPAALDALRDAGHQLIEG
jgi:hypothetical protein